MAERDKLFGFITMLDDAADILDEALEKFKGAINPDDAGFLDSMVQALSEMAEDYEIENGIESDIPEPINPTQDVVVPEIIEAEIVK